MAFTGEPQIRSLQMEGVADHLKPKTETEPEPRPEGPVAATPVVGEKDASEQQGACLHVLLHDAPIAGYRLVPVGYPDPERPTNIALCADCAELQTGTPKDTVADDGAGKAAPKVEKATTTKPVTADRRQKSGRDPA